MTLRDASNQSYFNTVQDLTLDAGHGNPGAVGLRFVSGNVGGVRNTLIRCPDRAQAWSLGAKLGEIYGPYLEMRNGSRMEMLGCVFNTSPAHLWKPDRQGVAIVVENADLALIAVDRIRDGAGEGPNAIMVRETSRGETRALRHASLPPPRWPGNKDNLSVVIPLYRSAGKN